MKNNTNFWLIILAIFVFAIFLLASQQGHANGSNTWFFEHKTFLIFIASIGGGFSLGKLIKSSK